MSRRRESYQPYQPLTRERLHAEAFGPMRVRRPAPTRPLRQPISRFDLACAAVWGALGMAVPGCSSYHDLLAPISFRPTPPLCAFLLDNGKSGVYAAFDDRLTIIVE